MGDARCGFCACSLVCTVSINKDALKPFSDKWQAPTGDEIKLLLKEGGLSGSKAGRLVGVNSRTIRRWTGGDQPIPFAAWALLVLHVRNEKIYSID